MPIWQRILKDVTGRVKVSHCRPMDDCDGGSKTTTPIGHYAAIWSRSILSPKQRLARWLLKQLLPLPTSTLPTLMKSTLLSATNIASTVPSTFVTSISVNSVRTWEWKMSRSVLLSVLQRVPLSWKEDCYSRKRLAIGNQVPEKKKPYSDLEVSIHPELECALSLTKIS